ncbi:MAG: glucose-1-phosphate thymidylyltransferase RfbA [Bacilli bacterium]|nr:glucose-1-phosphate thymidylyltransferase RfbA [Bacilli bacterium]MBO6195779.1 glucose-1-phosphate thymidylyltransferase RfbA [Bacilli bacterium]
MQRLDTINIGEILRNARENQGYTQEEVGEKLGLGRDAVIKIEKGTRKITIDEIKMLTNLYNIKIEEILSYGENPNVNMKGIILAGGSGTRLYPITKGISKQLTQVYDKPMIYYPLSVLMLAGIRDILIITTKEDQASFKKLLGDGSQFGINLEYTIQPSPDGLAQAFILGEDFIGDDPCAMILGDNIFFGNDFIKMLKNAKTNAQNGIATIFGNKVNDPQRFGIMELDSYNNVIGVEEKPENPKSDFAITGLYFYPKGVSKKAKLVQPSKRGELEITTLNDMYLKNGKLKAELLGGGFTWFDTGTFDSMYDATSMIRTVQKNNNTVISCPEAIAYKNGWIDEKTILKAAEEMKKNDYGKYLSKVVEKVSKENDKKLEYKMER